MQCAYDKRIRVLLVEDDNDMYFVDDMIDIACTELIINQKHYNDTSLSTVTVTNDLINKNNKLLDYRYIGKSDIAKQSLIEKPIDIENMNIGSDNYTFLSGYSSADELSLVFKTNAVYIKFSTTDDNLLGRPITLDFSGLYKYTNEYDNDMHNSFVIEHQDKTFIDVLREAGVSDEELMNLTSIDELFELNLITIVGFNPLDEANSHLFYLYPPLGDNYANIEECKILHYDYVDLKAIPTMDVINDIVTSHTENERNISDDKYINKSLVGKYDTNNTSFNYIIHRDGAPTFAIKTPLYETYSIFKFYDIAFDETYFDTSFAFSGAFNLYNTTLAIRCTDPDFLHYSDYFVYDYFKQHVKSDELRNKLPDGSKHIEFKLSIAFNGEYTVSEYYTDIPCCSIQSIDIFTEILNRECIINGQIYKSDIKAINNKLQNVITTSDLQCNYTNIISVENHNMNTASGVCRAYFSRNYNLRDILCSDYYEIHIKCHLKDDLENVYEETFDASRYREYIGSNCVFRAHNNKQNYIALCMYDDDYILTIVSIVIDGVPHYIDSCDVFELLIDNEYYNDKPASIGLIDTKLANYVGKTGNQTINGNLSNYDNTGVIKNPKSNIQMDIGKSFGFGAGIWVNGDISAVGHIAGNMTITHCAPIDGDISDFIVGKPVFMSGYVYKQVWESQSKFDWIKSTANDTQDCICSVKASGTWKEYVGIVVSIDVENNCLTFASHGDYLFIVNNISDYNIGDIVMYDGSIVDEDSTMTIKITQSIIGKVTSIVDDHTIAVFKD